MRISIIGTGYVGLVTGVGLASCGHKVTCVDIDKGKVERINKGESPMYEKGLSVLLKKVLRGRTFSATDDLKSAVLDSEVTFLAVPTPGRKDNSIDLAYIKTVSKGISSVLALTNDYHTVVVKSTVTPETCSKVILPILKKGSGKKLGEFGLCMNPEFLREGNAVFDFMNPDRIVIGELDKKSGDSLARVYGRFHADILRTSLENAEMIKYTNNAFLGTLISFSNEIANICETIPGANIFEVLKGLYLDKRLNPVVRGKRINPEILTYIFPGVGFGGSCLPKDIEALISFARRYKYNPKLLSAVLDINKDRSTHLVGLVEKELGDLESKQIAVLGLAFKPDTDDTRKSPSTSLIKKLLDKKALVSVYDPIVNPKYLSKELARNSHVEFCDSLQDVLKDKDACILATRWKEFGEITPELLKKTMRNPLIIDGRGFLDARKFIGKVSYIGVGISKNNTA